MIPVIFINCKEYPFMDDIISGRKWYETRTSDTLGRFVGQRVLFAETGNGRPVIRCSAFIRSAIEVTTPWRWEQYFRGLACIPKGSKYDWQPDTTVKYCYYITDVEPVRPMHVPEGKRHGRVWMELEKMPAEPVSTDSLDVIVITRYGNDDYSACWTDTDHLEDETYGTSVRGTCQQVFDEVNDTIPEKKLTNEDRLETLGLFIDLFEDFLEEKGINIANDEKDQDPDAAIIYGTDYGILSDRLELLLNELGMMKTDMFVHYNNR